MGADEWKGDRQVVATNLEKQRKLKHSPQTENSARVRLIRKLRS